MYIAPGQGQTTPWGQNFDVNRNSLSLCLFVASLKKISLKSDFLPFFYGFFSHVYSPGQGQTTQWRQKFHDNRKAFSLCPYVARFKVISSKSDFIPIFNDFIHIYSHWARAENPLGTNFWCQQKALITSTICCKFQTNLFEFWFYTHFLMFFPHVYSPGAGADNPLWTKFWCQQKGLVTLPICCKFQKNIFEVWFYTYFCLFLYKYIAPGQGQTTPWGQNFYFNINLLSLWSFAVSFFH